MRVKIIDEYNRIPTRTQSALLTVMGDGYAELLDHIYECPESAWYLTANDDQGGGTYQVIEALRDRIDVIVQALAFNPRFLGDLLSRIEDDLRPEEVVPRADHLHRGRDRSPAGRDPRGCVPDRCAAPHRVFRQPVRVLRGRRRAVRVQDQGHRPAGRHRLGARSPPRRRAATASRTSAARRATGSPCATS
jgi:hypothetical protein